MPRSVQFHIAGLPFKRLAAPDDLRLRHGWLLIAEPRRGGPAHSEWNFAPSWQAAVRDALHAMRKIDPLLHNITVSYAPIETDVGQL